MANVFLRSPYFISVDAEGDGAESVKLIISVEGVEIYTVIKNKKDSSNYVMFEIAELLRDYLDIGYNSTLIASDFSINASYVSESYSEVNGGGIIEATATVSFFGIDAYGYFEEGSNPTTTKGYMQSNTTIYKLGSDDIRIPIDRNNASAIAYYYEGVLVDSAVITSSATEAFIYLGEINDVDKVIITGTDGSVTLSVINIDECRFNPHKISFVNRWGGIQDLYFFKKSIETLNAKRETYKNSTITNTGTYDSLIHARKDFNIQSTKEITLNSGYVSEDYNAPMQELMQSEQVWMTVNNVITPMNVKDSSFVFKTSLNDKMVDYKLQLTYAFDAINNIR